MDDTTDSEWIASEGWPVMALGGGVTILLTLISLPLGCFALGLLVWLRHTLRVPVRRVPNITRAVLAPADGIVVEITDSETDPPAGTSVGSGHRITIRTGLADAHLQRSPVAGRVTDNFLIPGLFRSTADIALARRDNERREITIEGEDGQMYLLVQIGSVTARQLVCRHGPGKFLAAGAPLGMPRIGGLTDLFLPAGSKPAVRPGQTVVAGETVLATGPR
mgnify:FL=1